MNTFPMPKPRRMGEFGDLLLDRQIASPAGTAELGPLSAPITADQQMTQDQLLEAMYRLLRLLPYDLVMELRRQLLLVPRENVPIPASAFDTAVAVGATVQILSITIDDAFTGFLEFMGFAVSPGTSAGDISWSIKIGQSVHPKWSNFIAPANNIASPYKVMIQLPESSTITLFAKNNGTGPLNVSAFMLVNEEVIMSKPYGGSTGGII